jgi:hypothetical protein
MTLLLLFKYFYTLINNLLTIIDGEPLFPGDNEID